MTIKGLKQLPNAPSKVGVVYVSIENMNYNLLKVLYSFFSPISIEEIEVEQFKMIGYCEWFKLVNIEEKIPEYIIDFSLNQDGIYLDSIKELN